jgi:protein-S-isoprenylcysteine O-methyltransferase Ste14
VAWRLLKTLVFTVLVPGTVAGWLPQWLLEERHRSLPHPLHLSQYVGFVLLALGSAIYFWCAWDFAVKGLGTPAPVDAPRKLVVNGLFRYVRNPMYLGVLLIIFGQAILYGSPTVFVYMLGVWAFFSLFVLLYEEPELRRLFGAQYEAYCEQVRRWIPRRPKSEQASGQ